MARDLIPPTALRRDTILPVHHGDRRIDPYAWLRDPDWRAVVRDPARLDPAIRAHLEAENAFAAAALAPLAGLERTLLAELRGRIEEEDASVPLADGDWLYGVRYRAGGQHPIHLRRRRDATADVVLLDGDALADGHAFFRLGPVRHSPDHRFLAYAVDHAGAEAYTLVVRDIATGEEVAALADARGDFAWTADSLSLVFTRIDRHHRPTEVWRHRLGTRESAAELVHRESDPGFYLHVDRTESGRFVTIAAADHSMTAEVHLIDATRTESSPVCIAARERGVDYDVTDVGTRLFIRTNADGAEDFKIATAPIGAPGRSNWADVVGHRPGRMIRAMLAFRDHLVLLVRERAIPQILVYRLADGAIRAIGFEEEAYELGLVRGYAFETTTLRFTYGSMTRPQETWDYDLASGERTLRKTQRIPSGHDPSAYVVNRLEAPSHDGTMVPVTVLRRRDTPTDGAAPLVVYGYGAYGHAIPAGFAANRFSLVDRGVIYAIAHPRGGNDLGQAWYRAGKLADKPNTFRDFIACTERLIAAGLGDPARVIAHGGSAGGLLVGAVANMRPDLWRAIVAEVPFVDVLTTMLDAGLPLTPPEWFEWGNPIEDAAAYRTIRGYSPYDNIRAADYPAIYATAGLSDPRVTYWEPAKWVAKLRATATNRPLILFRTNMEAGHAGAAGRYDKLVEVARAYAFMLHVAGLATRRPAG